MNDRIITPRGVATLVTEADAEILKRNPVFKMHADNGFVAIEEVARPPSEDDVENAAAAMASRDGSAPWWMPTSRARRTTPYPQGARRGSKREATSHAREAGGHTSPAFFMEAHV
jgi:hypothetical protein